MKIYDKGKYRLKDVAKILEYKSKESVVGYIDNSPHLKCSVKTELYGKRTSRYVIGKDVKKLVIARYGSLEILEDLQL